MRYVKFTAVLLLFFHFVLYSQDEKRRIRDIVPEIEQYKDRVIVMNLKLKYVDRIFEKIVFYDSENVDIEFDISGKEKKYLLKNDLLNIHEGMLYSVKFRVIGEGNLGGILGEIAGFTPVLLEDIPESGDTP